MPGDHFNFNFWACPLFNKNKISWNKRASCKKTKQDILRCVSFRNIKQIHGHYIWLYVCVCVCVTASSECQNFIEQIVPMDISYRYIILFSIHFSAHRFTKLISVSRALFCIIGVMHPYMHVKQSCIQLF